MIKAKDIIDTYISFFEKRGHKRIQNSSLVPENDPTTLFTSSGMQPLVPYLLGEPHPQGNRLVNVQNSFRAQDIDEIGDNRHTTFFRMLGNWSLGDYFKKEQLPWMFEFLTKELKLDPKRLYVSVFKGLPAGRQTYQDIPKDEESARIWRELFESENIDPKGRIFYCGTEDNWWSRAGVPENMPPGEPGGPDSEVYFDLKPDGGNVKGSFKELSQSGRLLEIGNSVFMEYQKQADGSFKKLPKQNVDFGGGLERFLAAAEDASDVFTTNLLFPIIQTIENYTKKTYKKEPKEMRVITDHFIASLFILSSGITPSNKEQGYVLRRLVRRGLDNWQKIDGKEITPILESIIEQYKDTDPYIVGRYEHIKGVILEEEENYKRATTQAKKYIDKKYPSKGKIGDELKGSTKISSEDAFVLYTTHGLSPTQIKSLGYEFDEQEFAEKMKEHQTKSRASSSKKFAGGLADHHEKTIMGHTATHLLHQALRDVLGNEVHQTGSNITTDRIRFDFNYDQRLTDEQIQKVEKIVNEKIKDNMAVHFEMIPTEKAKELGAIGLFEETYGDKSKIYFIGGSSQKREDSYSVEFCGGPHVDFTGKLKQVKIIKQENLGKNQKRVYAVVGQ